MSRGQKAQNTSFTGIVPMVLTVSTPVGGSIQKVFTICISVSNFETFVTGKVKCMNSWGKVEEEPLLRPGTNHL